MLFDLSLLLHLLDGTPHPHVHSFFSFSTRLKKRALTAADREAMKRPRGPPLRFAPNPSPARYPGPPQHHRLGLSDRLCINKAKPALVRFAPRQGLLSDKNPCLLGKVFLFISNNKNIFSLERMAFDYVNKRRYSFCLAGYCGRTA